MKKTKIFSVIFIALISFFFSLSNVKAYIKDTSTPAVNTFTISNQYTITYNYSYIDENDVKHQLKASDSESYFGGTVLTLANRIDSTVDYSSVSYNINNSQYSSSTYTVTQAATIEYVYNLNRYTITYTLDGGTLSSPINNYTKMTPTFDLPTPTRNNYIFDGWCIGTNNCSKPYTVTQGSTGNISVTASWHQKQTYNVTYAGDTGSYSHTPTGNNVTATEGDTFQTTITISNNYNLDSVTITMGGTTLTQNTDYTYSVNGSTISIDIPNVNGAININVQTTSTGGNTPCLAEGTDVMLWDGTTKKIEDIGYNDLLKVWNHDLGRYGYEYAGWIETEGTTDHYTKVTFSDGSIIKAIGNHSVFSKELNKYVDINSNDLHVGDEVVNLENGISYVTVESIEHIEEPIKYYHVISSRYFNLITNNILTTYEIYTNISNFMDFDENLKWQNTDIVRSDMYTYDDFLYLDKYIYKVFRLEETKYLVNTGLVTPAEFEDLFTNYLMNNNKKVSPPTNSDGQRLWMVTTSDDTNLSSTTHQRVEGSEYTVPTPSNTHNFKYWYNHSDNKVYHPGDRIEVDSSMYLEAIYK